MLVVIHTPALDVLLIERADAAGFWQSVTGSKDTLTESWFDIAVREVHEETGLDALAPRHTLTDWALENVYEIYPGWRHRYAPGVTHNQEHVFALQVARAHPVCISPDEHLAWCWLPWQEAAEKCFSWSNRDAILLLGQQGAPPL